MASIEIMRERPQRCEQRLRPSARRRPERAGARDQEGKAAGVVMSMQHHEGLRGVAWERLVATMEAMSTEASANGLTEAGLEALLTDEN